MLCLFALLFLISPNFANPPSRFIGWAPGDHCECPDDRPYCFHLPGYFEPVKCLHDPDEITEAELISIGLVTSLFGLILVNFGFLIVICVLFRLLLKSRRPTRGPTKETKEEGTQMAEVIKMLNLNLYSILDALSFSDYLHWAGKSL